MEKSLQFLFIAVPLLLLAPTFSKSQDFTFSQFYEQPLLRNPALAGVFTGDFRASLVHRDQWGSITVPFKTTSLSIENKIPIGNKNDVLTIAGQISQDRAGDIRLTRTQILPAINFHKSLSDDNDTYLSGAFMGGIVFSQFDPSALKLGDQYINGTFSTSNTSSQNFSAISYTYWDLNAGLNFSTVLNNTKIYSGIGLMHLATPEIQSVTGNNVNPLKPRLTFNAGINTPIGNNCQLIAFADYITQQGNRQFLGGMMYGYAIKEFTDGMPDLLYFGSFYRAGDALIPVAKIDINHFSVGISYDINISSLKTVSNLRGGFEISMQYKGFLKSRNSTADKIRCVRF